MPLPFFQHTTYNSYIAANNALTVLCICFVNYVGYGLRFGLVKFFLDFRLVFFAEIGLTIICLWNMWKVSRSFIMPLFKNINLPFSSYIFAPGPLLTTIRNVFRFLRTELTSEKKPAQPVRAPQAPVQPLQNLKDDVQFTNLFLKNSTSPQQPQNIPATNPTGANTTTPNYTLQSVFNRPSDSFNINEINIAKASLENYGHVDLTKTASSGIPVSKQQTLLKLKYTPCVQPPLQPSSDRERLLWFLSPTPEVVDDFRIQQMIDLQKNWNRYNDRTSRIYYDKMTDALLKRIFTPLSKSIDFYNDMLKPRNRSVADCSAATVLLSMVMPTTPDVLFKLVDIEGFISIDGYTNTDGKEYVVSRIKDLASTSRMQTYRFLPTVAGMPTDATIIMHVFQKYLSLKEPYAIPPLVPCEGDLFKFLLVYIKITPELNHWNVFDLSDKL